MISREDAIIPRLREADLRAAISEAFWRAEKAAQIPNRTVDPFEDFRQCLTRMIADLNASLAVATSPARPLGGFARLV
jgi:hypothetical protein